MNITFEGPAVFVADIKRARNFYEEMLGQEMLADHGPHVVFKGGFSLWQTDSATEVIYGQAATLKGPLDAKNFELYFETENITAEWERVRKECEVINELAPAPWLQRCFRILDPDGHIVEIAEPLPQVINRLHAEGMSAEEINEKTGFPLEYVQYVLEK